ncbi:MAG TPA: DUF3990 domain-containing protein [Candidatus Scybalocola faecavium]|nr:DUF3990 domain-containing protein [Candidatus Scybalocola faecavium]
MLCQKLKELFDDPEHGDHGATEVIEKPSVSFSKSYLDFGKGFYLTTFQKQAEKWLEFVCACRRGYNIYKNYDIIIGAVANDDVFKTVDMYFRGIWSKEKALAELRYYKMNDQICITKQEVLGHRNSKFLLLTMM